MHSRTEELAEVLLSRLSAGKTSLLLGLSHYRCKRIKAEMKEKRIRGSERLAPTGRKARILTFMYERGLPVLDVVLFTPYYPSDVLGLLKRIC